MEILLVFSLFAFYKGRPGGTGLTGLLAASLCRTVATLLVPNSALHTARSAIPGLPLNPSHLCQTGWAPFVDANFTGYLQQLWFQWFRLQTSNHITGISHYGNGAFSESLLPRSSSISFPSLDTPGSARKISYYV